MAEIDEILKPPDYEERAKQLVWETPWRLNNRIHVDEGDRSISIHLYGSDDSMIGDAEDRFIAELEELADEDGHVSVSQVLRARSGDPEVDGELGWDINEMKEDRARFDIFSAHNYLVSGSIDVEEEGVGDVQSYDWEKVRGAYDEICEDAHKLGGSLKDEISAMIYRRGDRTVCVQVFFSFLFNDEVGTPAFDLEEAKQRVKRLIDEILTYNDEGIREIKVGKDEG